MRYISTFSGIEAASLAWEPLGWRPLAFAENERFPSAVLAYHWPDVPNLGDITQVKWEDYRGRADLVVGGSPCQSFSVAGIRQGLADPRGNLALEYLRIVDTVRPKWVVWENVPGVLSSSRGRDFGAFVGALAAIGYGFAWRVLDAQFFGVPQRRRRVFVVAHSGGKWQRAAAVLFERESLRGDPAPRRQAGERVAPPLEARTTAGGGGWGTDFTASRGLASDEETGPWWNGEDVSETLDCSRLVKQQAMPEKGRFAAVVEPLAFKVRGGVERENGSQGSTNIGKKAGKGYLGNEDGAFTVASTQDQWLQLGSTVRRLTPRECERLQGMPDDHTLIPWRGKPAEDCPDGPRYKAIGNSMAVPCMKWIGDRIQSVESLDI